MLEGGSSRVLGEQVLRSLDENEPERDRPERPDRGVEQVPRLPVHHLHAAHELRVRGQQVVSVHHGETQPDRTQFGLYFSTTTDVKPLYFLPVINRAFTIPPNDPHYKVEASWPIPTPLPLKLWVIAPHMHLLGKSMKVEMTPPGGAPECLVDVEDWDFNWQGGYVYKEPVSIPAGSQISLTAYYDNSENNPRNPSSPPKPVSWGEATTDEMCLAFLGFTIE